MDSTEKKNLQSYLGLKIEEGIKDHHHKISLELDDNPELTALYLYDRRHLWQYFQEIGDEYFNHHNIGLYLDARLEVEIYYLPEQKYLGLFEAQEDASFQKFCEEIRRRAMGNRNLGSMTKIKTDDLSVPIYQRYFAFYAVSEMLRKKGWCLIMKEGGIYLERV